MRPGDGHDGVLRHVPGCLLDPGSGRGQLLVCRRTYGPRVLQTASVLNDGVPRHRMCDAHAGRVRGWQVHGEHDLRAGKRACAGSLRRHQRLSPRLREEHRLRHRVARAALLPAESVPDGVAGGPRDTVRLPDSSQRSYSGGVRRLPQLLFNGRAVSGRDLPLHPRRLP